MAPGSDDVVALKGRIVDRGGFAARKMTAEEGHMYDTVMVRFEVRVSSPADSLTPQADIDQHVIQAEQTPQWLRLESP